MSGRLDLTAPLAFRPIYKSKVWGGRRMSQWRADLPDGPVGESWDLSDHEAGVSVVDGGPLDGRTLSELTSSAPNALVGADFAGGEFPLMVKLIDASDNLSVQVHPDDALARSLGVAPRGKTECWLIADDGGELYQGTRAGVGRAEFEAALRAGTLEQTLNRYAVKRGDFFFIPARTVHALGSGCLLYEVQQTCDVTFRVWDWGRMGLDGKPRQLHVSESLETIDFAAPSGPVRTAERQHPQAGTVRPLADNAYFTVEERRGRMSVGGDRRACSVIVCLGGPARLTTGGGSLEMAPFRTYLVPAAAGEWHSMGSDDCRLLVARPQFSG